MTRPAVVFWLAASSLAAERDVIVDIKGGAHASDVVHQMQSCKSVGLRSEPDGASWNGLANSACVMPKRCRETLTRDSRRILASCPRIHLIVMRGHSASRTLRKRATVPRIHVFIHRRVE
jgi:hypothetical protein